MEHLSQLQSKSISPTTWMVPETGRILASIPITEMERLLEIEFEDKRVLHHVPGQFVEVSLLGVGESPISVCSSPLRNHTFQICVRKIGNLTQALHQASLQSWVGIRGPYGRGFPVEQWQGKDLLLVAGGLGLAPLRSLIQYVFDRRPDFGNVTILIGAKSPEEILFYNEIQIWRKQPNTQIHLTVDRSNPGWKENIGVVTVLFNRMTMDPGRTVAVVVGPPIMYKFVILELILRHVPKENIFVSLERRMKCGIAKCGHCQMGGAYVCKEGPVFPYSEIERCQEAFDWIRK